METHVIDVLETRCRRAVRREVPKVLHEYDCFEDSLLGKSASSAGWIVHRWGLPKTDLSTKRGVDEVYRSIVEDLRTPWQHCFALGELAVRTLVSTTPAHQPEVDYGTARQVPEQAEP